MSSDLSRICERLVLLRAQQRAAIRALNRNDNAARAYVRQVMGWNWELPEKERKAINTRAEKLANTLRKGEEPDDPATPIVAMFVLRSAEAAKPYEEMRKEVEKEMRKLARALPAWERLKDIRGFGELSFAEIIGETGDLARFGGIRKVRKYFGLAPKEAYPTSDGGAPMYNKQRRSTMWVIVHSLLRSNHGIHRQIYEIERQRQVALNPEFDKGISKVTGKPQVALRADLRARRKVESQLLHDIWNAWFGEQRRL